MGPVRGEREVHQGLLREGEGGYCACGAGLVIEHASDLTVRSQSQENEIWGKTAMILDW